MAKRKRYYKRSGPYHSATKAEDDYKGGFTVFALKHILRLLALSWNKLGPGPTIGIIGVPILFIVISNVLSNSSSDAIKKVPAPASSNKDMIETRQQNNKSMKSSKTKEVIIQASPSEENEIPKPKAKEIPETKGQDFSKPKEPYKIQSAGRTESFPTTAVEKKSSTPIKSTENFSESVDLMNEFR